MGDGFPETVTAFREEMKVHGKFGQPCPDCGAPVQRIRYADNETNYCARCQTEGRLLADRALSRLLKGDWPQVDRRAGVARRATAGAAARRSAYCFTATPSRRGSAAPIRVPLGRT